MDNTQDEHQKTIQFKIMKFTGNNGEDIAAHLGVRPEDVRHTMIPSPGGKRGMCEGIIVRTPGATLAIRVNYWVFVGEGCYPFALGPEMLMFADGSDIFP